MTLRHLALTLFALLGAAGPAAAGTGRAAHAALLAGYWAEFLNHWVGVFQKQNGVVMLALGIGVVCLFIITRGKWRK